MKQRLLHMFTPRADPREELARLLPNLRNKAELLAWQATMLVTDAELERQLDELAPGLFDGSIAPDTHDRERAAKTQFALDSRRVRDDLAKQVQVGEARCLELVDEIHERREQEHRQRVAAEQQKFELARVAQLAAQQALARLDEEKFAADRQHIDVRASIRSRERRDWEQEDRALIRKWREGVRHEAAGVDPLPERLRERAERELRHLQEHEPAGAVERALAVRTVDPDTGLAVPAYSRFPRGGDDGPPVRP
jgi:hypothetical protein